MSAVQDKALVKMEFLSMVIGVDKPQTNSKNEDYQLLSNNKSVQQALQTLKEVGNDVLYKLMEEYFLNYLKSGPPGSIQAFSPLSNRMPPAKPEARRTQDLPRLPTPLNAASSSSREPTPGDLLEIFRTNNSCWAVYVGHGCVVHLAPPHQHSSVNVGNKKATWKDMALVKMELLSVVAGEDKYQVNNKHDDKYQPLPPNKIVQRAFKEVGNEVFYKLIQEYFLTYLRYGIPGSNQQEPKAGDLIEIFRRGYSHWAVYVGYGCVVHLAPPLIAEIAPLKRELLYVVVGSNRYQVNNKYDESDPPLPPSQIVHRALKLVGKMVPYNLLHNNCEHFATRIRSGVPRSDQIRNALLKLPGGNLAVNLMGLMN
ncbi:uncharacterized protein LOC100013657 isoform X2 [Monodelphis domestica]|uniref:uncharacterized protein LOC100013657 isoform X2 n=1 Tax=Monodelphis domestica TaxID=13616 RepID=UPI0024E263D3|nr:uncharacterized protein LOC100013657 isoform X2 [Monodelphis domestica]